MPTPFHAVIEWTAVVVVVFAVEDITATQHISTRALDESAVRVSIAVVAATKLEYSEDLDNAPAAIADLVGCGGSSRAEADVQEQKKRDHGCSDIDGNYPFSVTLASG